MENTITFSDSKQTSDSVFGTNADSAVIKPSSPEPIVSFEEYCKRHPDALECREYDV